MDNKKNATNNFSKRNHIASGQTILKKYKFWLLVIVVLPVIIILVLTFFLTLTLHKHQKEINAAEHYTMANHIVSDALNSLDTQAYSILTDADVNLFIFSNDISKEASVMNHTQRLLTDTLKINDCVISAQIYSFYNNYLFGTNAASHIDNFDKSKKIWLEHYEKTGLTDFILPLTEDKLERLCIVRSMRQNGHICAFFIFYIDVDALFSFKNDESYTLISNVDNTVLYSTSKNLNNYNSDFTPKGKLVDGRYTKSSIFILQ